MKLESKLVRIIMIAISICMIGTSYAHTVSDVDIKFRINDRWDEYINGEISVTNVSDDTIQNWSIKIPNNISIENIWNASAIKSDNQYVLMPKDYNHILRQNESIDIGFIAKGELMSAENITFLIQDEKWNQCIELGLDEIVYGQMDNNIDKVKYSYIPKESGSYKIIVDSETDIYINIYDAETNNIINTTKNMVNIQESAVTLLEGKTYTIELCKKDLDGEGTFKIKLNKIVIPTDSLFNEQWYLLNTKTGIDINILPVWDKVKQCDIKIGMADTGLYYNHEDLRENVMEQSYNFSHNTTDIFPEDELRGDMNTAIFGHGTHVAGIIGGIKDNGIGIAGIVPNAKLVELKTLGRRRQSEQVYIKSIAAFVQAVEYAQNNGIKIINCSFGGVAPSQAEEEVMKQANDILFVIAAGNNGCDLQEFPIYPACYYLDNAIVVANVDEQGNLEEASNYGGPVQIAAPGTNIISTLPYNQYDFMTGTSMSAPMVSAVCALVWNENPSMTANNLKKWIVNEENVTKISSLQDKVLSGGIINAYNVINVPSTERYEINDYNKKKVKRALVDNNEVYSNQVTDEIIVKTNDSIDEIYQELLEIGECKITGDLKIIDAYTIKFTNESNALKALNLLRNEQKVIYAEPNYVREYN